MYDPQGKMFQIITDFSSEPVEKEKLSTPNSISSESTHKE